MVWVAGWVARAPSQWNNTCHLITLYPY